MGVFSTDRFFSESYDATIQTPEPDMSYCGAGAANRILTEMVQNDQDFFGYIIRNDIQQAYVENAMNTNGVTDELVSKLSALQEAAAGGIFAKIKEFFIFLWKKIKGFFVGLYKKIKNAIIPDNKKLIDKYKEAVDKNAEALKKMKFKWCDVKGNGGKLEYKKKIDPSNNDYSKEKDKLYTYCDDELSYNRRNDDTEKTFDASVEALNKKVNNDQFYADTYGDYISDAPSKPNELAKACHNYFFDEEKEKDGEFDKYKSEILDCLNNSENIIKNLQDSEKSLDAYFKKEIAEADKIDKTYSKLTSKSDAKTYAGSIQRNPTSGEYYHNKGGEKTPDELVKNNVHVSIAKAANAIKSYTSKLQTCIIGLLNQQVAAVQFQTKQCRRVWTQAGTFSPKAENAFMTEAIGEAADFDTDQLFEAYED